MADTYKDAAHDPFASDAITEYYHIQSAYYAGSYANVTVAAAANYPVTTPTRYFVQLPLSIDVSALAGSRPISVYDVTAGTGLTRVSGVPGANQYRIPPATSVRRNVIEVHSGQAGDVLGFDYYGIETVINASSFETLLDLNGAINCAGDIITAEDLKIGDSKYIGCTSDTDLMQLTSDVLTVNGKILSADSIKRGTDGEYIQEKTVSTSSWNMYTTGTISIAHGIASLAALNIRSISIIVINTAGNLVAELCCDNGGWVTIDSTNVNLYRTGGGHFDHPDFNDSVVSVHIKWVSS